MDITNDWIFFISVCGVIITFTAYVIGLYIGYQKGKKQK